MNQFIKENVEKTSYCHDNASESTNGYKKDHVDEKNRLNQIDSFHSSGHLKMYTNLLL